MRRSLLLLVVCFVFAAVPVLAQNVLLPDDGNVNEKEPSVSLGLGVSQEEEEPALAEEPEPVAQVPNVAAPDVSGLMEPVLKQQKSQCAGGGNSCPGASGKEALELGGTIDFKAPPAPKLKPGGVLATGAGNLANDAAFAKLLAQGRTVEREEFNPLVAQARKAYEERAAQRARDPLVLDQLPLPQAGDDAINTLNVVLSGEYRWNDGDTFLVEKSLGYSREEIVQKCQLRVDVTLETDSEEGLYSGIVMADSKTGIKYGGILKSAKFKPMAVCEQPRGDLPRQGGVLVRWGNNIGIYLGSATPCNIESRQNPRDLFIKSEGGGKIACSYK